MASDPASFVRATFQSVSSFGIMLVRAMAARKTILIFDSGLGGLTVYREVAAARPDADFLYVADDAAFPYGALAEPALIARVVELMGELIAAHRPDLVVIACNTASTIVLAGVAQKIYSAVRRHRAGDQAGLRRLGDEARVRARHRGDGAARIYPRAHSRLRARLRGDAGRRRSTLAGYAEAELARRAGRRCRIARRDRALLSRRRQAHRHRRAGLHPLSRC